jgi:acetyl esterase/lipase
LPGISKIISLSRKLASLLSATVVAPAYRLAPEHPFPAAVDDTWAVVQWVAKNNATLGADLTKGFIIGGISSGANLAVVLTRRAVEFGISPPVTGAWAPLFMAFNNKDDIPERYRHLWRSRTQNKDALVIDSTKAEVMFGYYKPDSASPLFNPLAGANAGGFNLGRMPRIHLQIAGADLFRDDGVILAYALQESGVPVKIDIYPGMPHSFWLFAPELEASKRCMRDIIAGFAWLLDVELDSLPPGWQELSLIGCRIHNSAASQTE